MKPTVLLFGESEKGTLGMPSPCFSLTQLSCLFGEATKEGIGIFYAVQTLLYDKKLLFCRVEEEGWSLADYRKGLCAMRSYPQESPPQALFLPGVVDPTLIQEAERFCFLYKSVLMVTEKDLYDYLTIRH